MLTGNLDRDTQAEFEKQVEDTITAYSGLGKGKVLKQVVRFYKKYENELSPLNSDLACKPGCNYCCHYHVLVTAPEAFAIIEHIEKLPKTERDQIHDKIKSTAEVASKLTSQEYIDTNIPCAFLVDGKCSVYEIRPLACRRHHSLDVKICEETFHDVHSKADNPMRYDRMVMSSALENAHLYTQHHKKLDTTQYEMHAALNQAISNKSVFQRWLDHKMAFPNVKDRHVLERSVMG